MTKRQMIRESLEKLGLNSGVKTVSNYVKKNYKVAIPETTFYTIRKSMREEAALNSVLCQPAKFAQPLNKVQTDNGILALVRSAKQLIESLGKNDAKQLIDSL